MRRLGYSMARRCEEADPASRCKCRCRGSFHGTRRQVALLPDVDPHHVSNAWCAWCGAGEARAVARRSWVRSAGRYICPACVAEGESQQRRSNNGGPS
jgi:hypothetical protein